MKTMKLIAVSVFLFGLLSNITAKNISFETLMTSNNLCAEKTTLTKPQNDPKYGKDSVQCVTNLSIYREFFRQKNYADAIDPWRWVFFNCPASSQNMYLDGVVIFKELINAETNTDKKELFVDTLMMIYDQRIKIFGREGFVLGRKGVDLALFSPTRIEEIFTITKKSIELEKNQSKSDVLFVHFQSAIKLSENEKYGKSIIMDAYNTVSDIVDWNLKNNLNDSAFFNPTKVNIELLFAPLATCPDLINIYTKKYEETPNDKDLLMSITSMLNRYNCTDEELFFKATESLHKIDPTANSAYLMGRMSNSKKQYAKAVEYLQEAVKLYKADENDNKAEALLLLADINYRFLSQLVRARNFALQSFELRPTDGRPMLIIGDMYASSASSCGDNEIEKRSAYWAAVDKYNRAKNIDSSLEKLANDRIASCIPQFPDKETIFFHNLQIGQSYTVGCWINETTTIRASN